MKKGWSFCCHHDIFFEYCNDFEQRRRVIKETKPTHEHKARLNSFVLIPAKLLRDLPGFTALDKALAVHDKALAVLAKALAVHANWAAYDKAWAAYREAEAVFVKENYTALVALHKKLAPKNTWNGKNIGWV